MGRPTGRGVAAVPPHSAYLLAARTPGPDRGRLPHTTGSSRWQVEGVWSPLATLGRLALGC